MADKNIFEIFQFYHPVHLIGGRRSLFSKDFHETITHAALTINHDFMLSLVLGSPLFFMQQCFRIFIDIRCHRLRHSITM